MSDEDLFRDWLLATPGCADTFPGHDDAAVVVRGDVEGPHGGHVPVEIALHPHSPYARIIREAPFSAYRIRDERLPRL